MDNKLKSILLSCIFGIIFSVTLVVINHRIYETKNEVVSELPAELKDETNIKVAKEENEEVKKEDKIQSVEEIIVENNTIVNKTNDNIVNNESQVKEENIQDNITSNSNSDSNLGTFRLTAYCNCSQCCGQWAGGATASGVMPTANNTIAVDTRVIPFGTKVIINGITYTAEDTGSAIKGNKIDIYMSSHEEAVNFGVQYAEVYKIVY